MPLKMPGKKGRPRERGSALVEFVLCISLFWVPLFFGTLVIGFNLVRVLQVTQVCRDAGHMYSFGIDFSQAAYQNLLVSLSRGLNMTTTGGNGVIILSTVTYIAGTDCTAGGYQANTTSCPNMNQTVFTRRIVIGNASLHASTFGTPSSGNMDSSGNVSSAGYLTNTADRAVAFSNIMTISSGQYAYVSEMFVTSPDFSWWGPLGTTASNSRSIF